MNQQDPKAAGSSTTALYPNDLPRRTLAEMATDIQAWFDRHADLGISRHNRISKLGKTIDTYFTEDILTGLMVCLWTGSDIVGFWLVFENLDSAYISKLQEWMKHYNIKLLEVMHKSTSERDKLRNEFILKPDIRFIGAFDMDIAFRTIEKRLRKANKLP